MTASTRSPIADFLEQLQAALGTATGSETLGSIALGELSGAGIEPQWPSISDIRREGLTYDSFKRQAREAWETLFYFASAVGYARVKSSKEESQETERKAVLISLDRVFAAKDGRINTRQFNAFLTDSRSRLKSVHQVRYALLAVEVYVELLWVLHEVMDDDICVPVCAGRNSSLAGAQLVEFVTMHFHRCAVKLDISHRNHVVTNQDSDEFHGWRLDDLQGFSEDNAHLESLYEKSDPVTLRQAKEDWKYIWFPNYVEFFHQASTQLVSAYVAAGPHSDPTVDAAWEYIATNGTRLTVDSTSRPPWQTWDQNAALYEIDYRTREDRRSQASTISHRHAFKITLAICIPFGQVVADHERQAFALYINLVFYQTEQTAKMSRELLVDVSRRLHGRLDSLRYIALRTLASEQVLAAEEQTRELKAQQNVYLNVMPEVKDINTIISSLQKKIQFVNAQIAPPAEGIMSAYNEVSQLFEQGYRLKLEHREDILIPHKPDHYQSRGSIRAADCAWVLGKAIDWMLGETTVALGVTKEGRRVPANGPLDVRLAHTYLAAVLGQLRSRKATPIGDSIDKLTRLTPKDRVEPVKGRLIDDRFPEPAEQIEFLQNFKQRFHAALKFGRADSALKLDQLLPYLPLLTWPPEPEAMWVRYGLTSHAPLISFLSYFVGLHRAAVEAKVGFHITQFRTADEDTTTFRLEVDTNEDLLRSGGEFNPVDIRNLLNRLWGHFQKHGVPMNQTGYSYGDVIAPFVKLVESVHRDSNFRASVTGGLLNLHFPDTSSPKYLSISIEPTLRQVSFSNAITPTSK